MFFQLKIFEDCPIGQKHYFPDPVTIIQQLDKIYLPQCFQQQTDLYWTCMGYFPKQSNPNVVVSKRQSIPKYWWHVVFKISCQSVGDKWLQIVLCFSTPWWLFLSESMVCVLLQSTDKCLCPSCVHNYLLYSSGKQHFVNKCTNSEHSKEKTNLSNWYHWQKGKHLHWSKCYLHSSLWHVTCDLSLHNMGCWFNISKCFCFGKRQMESWNILLPVICPCADV